MADSDCLEFKRLCAEIHSKKFNKMILNNINFVANSGKSLAIMGSSGAGKTTLLNIIRGAISAAILTNGSILLNGNELDKEYDKHVYIVEQSEISTLYYSVYEHLYSVARGMNRRLEYSEIEEKIEGVLKALSLNNIRNTKMKDVSGGELKRVNVAQALLTDRKIIILDEPTSGLDSKLAIELIYTATEFIKKENRILILSIHQPSNAIMHMIDDVLFIKDGKSIYYGKYDNIENYFEERGFIFSNKLYTLIEFLYFLGAESEIDEETKKNKIAFSVFERGIKMVEFNKEMSKKNTYRVKNVFNMGLFFMLFKKEFVFRMRTLFTVELFSIVIHSILLFAFLLVLGNYLDIVLVKQFNYSPDSVVQLYNVGIYDFLTFFCGIWFISALNTSMQYRSKKIKEIEKGHYALIEYLLAVFSYTTLKIIFMVILSFLCVLIFKGFNFYSKYNLSSLLIWFIFYYLAIMIQSTFLFILTNGSFNAYVLYLLCHASNSRLYKPFDGLFKNNILKLIVRWIVFLVNLTPLPFISILYHRKYRNLNVQGFLKFDDDLSDSLWGDVDWLVLVMETGQYIYLFVFLMLLVIIFTTISLFNSRFSTSERIPLEKRK